MRVLLNSADTHGSQDSMSDGLALRHSLRA